MLVLSRKRDERIVLTRGDERIEIVVCKVQIEQAQIGIEASTDWEILRKELEPSDEAKQSIAQTEVGPC